MRRRAFLRILGTTVGLGAVGSGRGDSRSTARRATDRAFAPLGRLAIPGAMEAVVGPDGTTAYLAVDDGFAVVDVADPREPELLADRRGLLADADGGPMRAIQDVSVEGDRLLVVGPAHPGIRGPKGALLYDVSEPAAPERVAVHRTGYPIHNAVLADGRAYLTELSHDVSALSIVSTEGSPARIGSWSPALVDAGFEDVPVQLWPHHDLTVREGIAYCCFWDAGTWIVDVRDPAEPRHLGRVGGRPPAELAAVERPGVESRELPGNHHSCSLDPERDLLAIGHEAWDGDDDGEGGPGGVDLVDVSTPAEPAVRSTIDPPATADPSRAGVWTTAHNFELRDGVLYSAWYQGGIRVHDVTDPERPREIAAWRDAGAARFWTAQVGSGAVVAASMGTDGSDPGLFTFPDPAADGTATRTRETPTARSTEPTATGAASRERASSSETTGDGLTATPGLAGFGAGAALAGLGLVALRSWRRRGSD